MHIRRGYDQERDALSVQLFFQPADETDRVGIYNPARFVAVPPAFGIKPVRFLVRKGISVFERLFGDFCVICPAKESNLSVIRIVMTSDLLAFLCFLRDRPLISLNDMKT